MGSCNIIPQDIGRVLLNLFNNAFYAVSEKNLQNIPGYEPTVTVTTKLEHGIPDENDSGGKIRNSQSAIRNCLWERDNGNGIPDKLKEKDFPALFYHQANR